jgi:hypothetical protein
VGNITREERLRREAKATAASITAHTGEGPESNGSLGAPAHRPPAARHPDVSTRQQGNKQPRAPKPEQLPEKKLPVLWRANMGAGKHKSQFHFRSTEEFCEASRTAEELLESSSDMEMPGNAIVGIERICRLWN